MSRLDDDFGLVDAGKPCDRLAPHTGHLNNPQPSHLVTSPRLPLQRTWDLPHPAAPSFHTRPGPPPMEPLFRWVRPWVSAVRPSARRSSPGASLVDELDAIHEATLVEERLLLMCRVRFSASTAAQRVDRMGPAVTDSDRQYVCLTRKGGRGDE